MASSVASLDELTQPISESFLHLSRDDTVDLASLSDITNTFSNDLLVYLRMARSLDHKGQKTPHKTPLLSTASKGKSTPFDVQGAIGMLPHLSLNQSTPLIPRTQSKKTDRLSDINESAGSDQQHQAAELYREIHPLLLQTLQQFKESIESMLAQKQLRANDQCITPIRSHSLNNSSDDDKLSLQGERSEKAAKTTRVSLLDESPVTTPPHSRDCDDAKSTLPVLTDDYTHEEFDCDDSYIPKTKQSIPLSEHNRTIEELQRQIDELKLAVRENERQESKKSHQPQQGPISVDIPSEDLLMPEKHAHFAEETIRGLNTTIKGLKHNLEAAELNNSELQNEVLYLKHQVPSKSQDSSSQLQARVDALEAENRHLRAKNGDESNLMEANTVPARFREYYHRLKLDKIDTMDRVALANTIKNMLLSFLVTDVDSLPTASAKIGRYLKLTGKFIDRVHEHLYESEVQPSTYLTNADFGPELAELTACLDGMVARITSEPE